MLKNEVERIVEVYNAWKQNKREAMNTRPAHPDVVDSEKVLAVKNLITKVEAENFVTKKDALDVLKDIASKVKKNQPVPNYLVEGLKSYLVEAPSLTKEMESLVELLK